MSITGTPITPGTSGVYLTYAELEARIGDDQRPEAIALKAASDTVQNWYIKTATAAIDRIEYTGFPLEDDQDNAFPRKYNKSDYVSPWGETVTEDAYGYIYDSASAPEDVLEACKEEAIALYDLYVTTPDHLTRAKLQKDGVSSATYGDVSESYNSPPSMGRFAGLRSSEAYALLSKFMNRTFRIV